MSGKGKGSVKRKSASSKTPSKPSKSLKKSISVDAPDFMRHLPLSGDVAEGDDEEIDSDDPDVTGANYDEDAAAKARRDNGYGSNEEEEGGALAETAEEKRLRLAKAYLEEITKVEQERADDKSVLHDAVSHRLRHDDLEDSGKLKQEVASKYRAPDPAGMVHVRDHRCHKEAVNCVAVAPCGKVFFTGSTDAGIVRWSLDFSSQSSSGSSSPSVRVTRTGRILGGKRKESDEDKKHCHRINALAISTNGKFLAAGDDSKHLRVWDPTSLSLLHTFRGHRDAVTGLAFRRKTTQLYSASADRCVKSWNLDEMAYVETLHGHQDRVTGIDAGVRERCITAGGRDGSVRIFKIVEESQLVFNASNASTDAVRLINEEHFLTAGEDGHISLWGVMKKKPLFTVRAAHGRDPVNDAPRWISALAPLPMTDLLATGSCDGVIRFWRCSSSFRSLEPLPHLNVVLPGFINALAFTPCGRALVACVGRTHRLGGWWRLGKDSGVKNGVVVIPLRRESDVGEETEAMEM